MSQHEDMLPILAAEVVKKVLEEGAETHRPGQWRGESVLHHLEHADGHTVRAGMMKDGFPIEGNWVEEAEHAICRLVMALYLDEEPEE